jgi:hypothetical protein
MTPARDRMTGPGPSGFDETPDAGKCHLIQYSEKQNSSKKCISQMLGFKRWRTEMHTTNCKFLPRGASSIAEDLFLKISWSHWIHACLQGDLIEAL